MKSRFWDGNEEPIAISEHGKPSYVTLRAPHEVSGSSLLSATLRGAFVWHLSHSTSERWKDKRNVRLSDGRGSLQCEHATPTVEWSWQAMDREEVQRIHLTKSEAEDRYVVLGTGKEGSLAGWMIETEYGIRDSTGEVRGDWRSQWLVLYSPAIGSSTPSIDVLTTRLRIDKHTGRKYVAKPETLERIKSAFIEMMGAETLKSLGRDLFEVKVDGERDADELPKPSPKEQGIWSPEVNVDNARREKSKCAIQ